MDVKTGPQERHRGHAHHNQHQHHAYGTEVTPDRDSLGKPGKRARRRLETDTGGDDVEADDSHDNDWGAMHNRRDGHDGHGQGRPEENKAQMAQLLSESIIELLHVCTLIQVELNNNTNTANNNQLQSSRGHDDGVKYEGPDRHASSGT